jgi:chemotaxis protein MotB
MARRKKHEEHVNAEAWAIPYGDLITLLLAFFVVMYSMSSVNEGKYRILSDSLVAAFRGAPATVAPINVGEASKGKGGDAHLQGVTPTALMKLRDPRPMPDADDRKDGPGDGMGVGRGQSEQKEALFYMAEEVRKALQGLIDRDLVRVRQTPLQLEVEIKTDILFGSGVATIGESAVPAVRKVAEILRPFPNAIRVEGHTDDRPIRTAAFPSNWELSAARAANVVQLFTEAGVDPARMEVLGLGSNRPVADNASVEGRNANRRVVIVVLQQPDGEPPRASRPADGFVPGAPTAPEATTAGTPTTAAAPTPAGAPTSAPATAGAPTAANAPAAAPPTVLAVPPAP